MIYIVTGADDVFAISVETGEILWKYFAELDPAIDTACCSWTSRGVGLGEGKIFVGQLDGKLVALNQATGEPAWSVQAEHWNAGYTITSAPLYYEGLVITGFAGAEFGVRGRVKAYHADDGAPAWTFYTIPGPGEFGHDTWSQDNEVWANGGGTVWQTPAADPELGMLYFSTGNPGPDMNGAVRPGDKLFTSSIVAIDAETGEYRWHYQQVHHDIWDYDSANPVVLFDIEIDGVLRRGLAEVNKTGWAYILDRTNGEPLIGIKERPVPQNQDQITAPTQPYPVGDSIVPQFIDKPPEGIDLVNEGRIFTPFWRDWVAVRPGQGGGGNWPPNSYDIETGILYICGTDMIGNYRGGEDNEIPPDGERYMGGVFQTHNEFGVLVAMDMSTNTITWKQEWPRRCYSGSTVTAGGLLFVGRSDGRLTALDSSNGDMLWEFQTGAGMNAPTAVFQHEGEQYLAAYSAGNLFAGSARGDSVWLFSLNGTMDEVAAAETLIPPVAISDRGASDPSLTYQKSCLPCHGESGQGGHGGGSALTALADAGTARQVIAEGQNTMPAFGGAFTAPQIEALAEWIYAQFTVQE